MFSFFKKRKISKTEDEPPLVSRGKNVVAFPENGGYRYMVRINGEWHDLGIRKSKQNQEKTYEKSLIKNRLPAKET